MDYYLGALKKYAVFSGRATRKEYWMFFLYNILIGFAYQLLTGFILSFLGIVPSPSNLTSFIIFIIISFLYSLFIIIPTYAVMTRRLHDTGHSGWWMLSFILIQAVTFGLAFFIPFMIMIGFIVSLVVGITIFVFLLTDSQPGENKYGPNPKGVQSSNNPPSQAVV